MNISGRLGLENLFQDSSWNIHRAEREGKTFPTVISGVDYERIRLERVAYFMSTCAKWQTLSSRWTDGFSTYRGFYSYNQPAFRLVPIWM